MDEEINPEGSLEDKSVHSLESSQKIKGSVTTSLEEDYEEKSSENDVEGTIASQGARISKYDFDIESYLKEESDENTFLKNPGLSQAYHLGQAKPPTYEVDDVFYLRLIKEAKIMPIKRIVNAFHLNKSAVYLQYYGLRSEQMRPLAETLMDHYSIKELNLKSNILSLDALYHLGLLLRKNVCLTVLNLSQCKITAEGINLLGNGLELCPVLAFLDLSYNEFGDDGTEILAIKLCYNTSITDLNLSHNNLTHKTGIHLAETMEENDTLQHLDLAWNQIAEDQGLKKFLYAAAEHNDSILTLDLSWNTLSGEKTANTIKTFIGQHKSLQEINLSHNRFENAAEVTKIAKGINTAQNLREINLSYNGMTADTAFALLSNINNKTKLKTLRLDNVWVKPEFEKLRKELENQTEMKVIIEGVTGGIKVKGPDMQTLLLKRAHHLGYLPKKAKNKKDFGWFLLRLQKTGNLVPVKKAKFEKLVEEDKIKFDEGMVEELAKRFKDDNKKIDLSLMLEKYLLLYPETALPIPKEKKKKKEEPKTETEGEARKSEEEEKQKSPGSTVEPEIEGDRKESIRSKQRLTVTEGDRKESIRSKQRLTITSKVETEVKETIEVDGEKIEREMPKLESLEQTEGNIIAENEVEEKDTEIQVENKKEDSKTEVELSERVYAENETEVKADNISKEQQKDEEQKEDELKEKDQNNRDSEEAEGESKKWRVARPS